MNKTKISAVISAFNAEKTIEKTLKSVAFCDEIIFVDNESTDRTAKIAQKYTSKIFTQKNNLMLNINKNYGFVKAEGEWILNLDSDEQVSTELKEEILSVTSAETGINGFTIPRKNIIFGKWIKHTGWYPDYQLRLFRKGKGKFPEEHVHEIIAVEGNTENLVNYIIHENYQTIFQFIQKLTVIYAPNEAEQIIKNGYVLDYMDSIRFPLKEFLSRFFVREGYRDGFHGLMLSILMSFYHFIIFSYIWEKQGFKEMEDENVLLKTEKEIKRGYSEFIYWISNEKIKSTKGFFKKSLLMLQRRLT